MKYSEMTLHEISKEIQKDWKNPNYSAKPYISAMRYMDYKTKSEIQTGTYGEDSAESIILYFLSNAQTWRGALAKEIKSHLKSLIK